MTTRTTAIIAAFTVVVAFYLFVIDRNFGDLENRDFSAIPISNTSDIAALKISSASGIIILQRDRKNNSNWKMTAPVDDRADAKQIEELLTALVNLKKQQDIKGENAPSMEAMGLNEPALELTLEGIDGKKIGVLKFGNDAGFVDSIYARWENDTPFACWSDTRILAEVAHDALRDIRLLAIPVEKMLADGLIDEGWAVPDEASFKMSRILAKTTGALLGPTTGMQVFAALRSRVSHIFYLLYAPRPASSVRLHTGLCRTFARSRAPRAQIDSCHRLRRRSRRTPFPKEPGRRIPNGVCTSG